MQAFIQVQDGLNISFVVREPVNGSGIQAAFAKCAKRLGRQWTDHFAGTETDARIYAAMAVGVFLAGGRRDAIQTRIGYFGRDLVAGIDHAE